MTSDDAILARYASRCSICHRVIRKFTDLIVRTEDGWAHERCAEADRDEEASS